MTELLATLHISPSPPAQNHQTMQPFCSWPKHRHSRETSRCRRNEREHRLRRLRKGPLLGVCLLREARRLGHVSDLPRNEGFPTEEKPIIATPFPSNFGDG